VKTRKYRVYADSCVLIAWCGGEERTNHEMDGVRDCFEKVERGEIVLIVLRNMLFTEVKLKTLDVADKFSQLMSRKTVEIPSLDLRVDRLATELRDYYSKNGKKELYRNDSLHLATAIHYKADAFYTFDNGKKGGISLLSLNGSVAGHPLLICKPPFTQSRLF
jgi:predicted nucleic acid-binding protein